MRLHAAEEIPGLAEWDKLPAPIKNILPVEDAWGLTEETRAIRLSREMRRRARLAQMLADGRDPDQANRPVWSKRDVERKRAAFKRACAADPSFFADNCIWTMDTEGRLGLGTVLPKILFRYEKRLWLDVWRANLKRRAGERRICAHEKGRRVGISICRMIFELWKFRFRPGSSSWVSTDSDTSLDGGEDWWSLLGKFRFFWLQCRNAYPWLFPELPNHSDCNKFKYLRFPEWRDGDDDIDRACWGNELRGLLPSEVAGRGGASGEGFMDEAAWVKELQKFKDAIQAMTPSLCYASTAGESTENPFYKIFYETKGVTRNGVFWCTAPNPVFCEGIAWVEEDTEGEWAFKGEDRGPHTRKWRSRVYNEEAKGSTKEEMARNWDGDWSATAGRRIFLTYSPQRNHAEEWDLYKPELPLMWTCDVGGGDLWAWAAIQWSDVTGEVNIVDYFSDDDKTIQFFIPVILGWDWEQRQRWACAFSRKPWKDEVPWPYRKWDIERMVYWREKRRPKFVVYDYTGGKNPGSIVHSVYGILKHYRLQPRALPMQHHREDFIDHANEVMNRVRISKRLIGEKPRGTDPSIDEVLQFWRRVEPTERNPKTPPMHDAFSHGGTMLLYGFQWIRGGIYGIRKLDEETGQRRQQFLPEHRRGGHFAGRTKGWHRKEA